MGKIVRYKYELGKLPPLTGKQKKELKALKDRPIDFSDIPPLTEKFWKNAVQGKYLKPTKTSTTVRLDSDVLAWLKGQGKGYQTRINLILRREMMQSSK